MLGHKRPVGSDYSSIISLMVYLHYVSCLATNLTTVTCIEPGLCSLEGLYWLSRQIEGIFFAHPAHMIRA